MTNFYHFSTGKETTDLHLIMCGARQALEEAEVEVVGELYHLQWLASAVHQLGLLRTLTEEVIMACPLDERADMWRTRGDYLSNVLKALLLLVWADECMN